MAGERCKNFLRSLDICELKKIVVVIKKKKRSNILTNKQSVCPQPIYRGLEDRKNLKVHFKTESLHGIFDREDIIINQEYAEEEIILNRQGSKPKSDDRSKFHKERNCSRYEDSSEQSTDNAEYKRSRSRSGDSYQMDSTRCRRERSHSPLYKKHSPSPKESSSKKKSLIRPRRSRSHSPNSLPNKKPGLYIPPKSDYLRYEKRKSGKSDRSRSPELSHRTKFNKEKRCRTVSEERERSKSPSGDHASTSKKYSRTGYRNKSRSRSSSIEKSRGRPRQRTNSHSPDRIKLRHRYEEKDKLRDESNRNSRSRSPFRTRSSRRSRSPNDRRHSSRGRRYSRSPPRKCKYSRRRSRSHSGNRDKMIEDNMYFHPNMQPYIIKIPQAQKNDSGINISLFPHDGEYWIPAGSIAGPGYIPRGFIPQNMLYPRGFHPPMMMPRMPIMQPFRPRIYRPRICTPFNATSTAINNSQKEDEQSLNKCDVENPNNLQLLEVPVTKESTVIINEISSEKDESLKK